MLTANVDLPSGSARVVAERGSPEWEAVRALMPNPPATCLSCGGVVIAAEGPKVAPHYKHRHKPETCAFNNETADHLRLKAEVKAIIEATPGWTAALEVPAEDSGWIVDVMATSSDTGDRVAFEIQLSPQDANLSLMHI